MSSSHGDCPLRGNHEEEQVKQRINGVRCVLAAVAMMFSGCSGSGTICARTAKVASREKVKDCRSITDNMTLDPNFSVDKCESSTQACTDEDKAKMEDFLDCYEALDTCKAETERDYIPGWSECVLKSKGLSDACHLQ
jgi:hypothetical protein